MTDEVALMVVRAGAVDVGLDAARVREVVPIEQWTGEAALDLLQLVGAAGAEGNVRILVVARDGREPLAALVSGTVTLRHVTRAQLLAVPAPLDAHVRWVSHIVVGKDGAPLLVVDAERLAD
jgi:chemotaxis signal transduction protein